MAFAKDDNIGVTLDGGGQPAGSVTYLANGKTYAIPAAEEAAFLKDHPKAVKQ